MKDIIYKYEYTSCEYARIIGHKVKANELAFIAKMARELADLITPASLLIPIPNHSGNAEYTLTLAQQMASLHSDVQVLDILKGNARRSTYECKKNGIDPKDNFPGFYLLDHEIPDKRMYLVDNVIGTGMTISSASNLLPKADIVVHSVDIKAFELSGYRQQFDKVKLENRWRIDQNNAVVRKPGIR